MTVDLAAAARALLQIFVLAVLIESIALAVKTVMPKRWLKVVKDYIPLATIVLGIWICMSYGADLPAALGLPRIQYVGSAITGFIAGRGSNFLHDVISRVRTIQLPAAPVTDIVEAGSVVTTTVTPPAQRYRAGPWEIVPIDEEPVQGKGDAA